MASYREFAVPGPAGALVECGWRSRVGAAEPAHRQRVLPDGCMDLIWSGGELVVAGPDTAAFTVDRATGSIGVGLRFRPGAAPALLGVPACELRDRRVPLADVHPGLATRVTTLLAAGHDPADALVTGLLRQLPDTAPPAPAVRRAAALLARGTGVAATADRLGWTSRTLHRRALDAFGYGPTTLRRVLRFRRAVALVGSGRPPAEVAARAGYADQAHLSREVRALAGATMGQLVAEVSGANRSTAVPSGSRSVA